MFIAERTAMLISSTSDVTLMEKSAVEKGFELGTAFIPVPKDIKRNGVVIGGASLWLTKDHPESELQAATEFVLWMSMPEQTIRWHKVTGAGPQGMTNWGVAMAGAIIAIIPPLLIFLLLQEQFMKGFALAEEK